ncbi:MAG: hypothetical protein ACM3JG_20855 [Thiohalocapsa sp.]
MSWLAARLAPLVEARLARRLTSVLDDHVERRLLPELQERVEAILDGALQSKQGHYQGVVARAVEQALNERERAKPLLGSHLYRLNEIVAGSFDGPYMAASNVLARDFLHPEFAAFCQALHHPVITHRKLWEYAFIHHHAKAAGALTAGKRGLGFGVGREQLPSLFAGLGMQVTATDAPGDEQGWHVANEYAGDKEHLYHPPLVGREAFEANVTFEFADMNEIPPHLAGFDLCWSSCALEHLGSLQNGLDFIVNSVEKTLRVGGVACHTTELNLSSNDDTMDSGRTVIYRKRDLEALCRRLEERGHRVAPLRIEPGSLIADYLVDVPPYRADPCLKFQLGRYVSTSVGIVAWRGR